MKTIIFFVFGFLFYSAGVFAQTATDLNCTSCVQTAEIQNSAVTAQKLQTNAVTTLKISDGTITNTDISSTAAIDASKISGTAWTSTNDGSGSSLEADLLDGLDGAQFLRNDQSGTFNGDLHIAGGHIALSRDDTFSGMYILGEDNAGDRTMQFRNTSSEPTGGWSFYASDSAFNAIRLKINNDGNVGIGTTNPVTQLDVNGVISLHGQRFLDLDNGNTFYIGDLASGDGTVATLHLRTNDQNRLTIDGDGDVGIGTTSPATPLDVNGIISINGQKFLQYSDDADAFSIGDLAGGDGYVATLNLRTNDENRLTIDGNGNVGIGTTNPGNFKLAVEGIIGARELKVTEDSWSDFVFKEDYPLKSLAEVESFIQQNKHLPDIPSESEVLANGVSVGDMQKRLLQKVEELTLYVIEQNKELDHLKKDNEALKNQVNQFSLGDRS